MDTIERLIETPFLGGKSLADLLTLEWLLALVGDIAGALLILFVALWLSGFVSRRIRRIAERNPRLDNTLFSFLGNIARWAILALGLTTVLTSLGVQTASIIAAIGAAGLAIGLALQGTLSNLAAGVMIVVFRPFNVGNFVEVAGKMGTVKSITLNFTELASLSNVQIIIPNSEVWGNKIENYSVYPTRRAEWTFGVGYDADLKQAETVIRNTITADPRTRPEPEPFVQVNNLGDSSVDFLVRAWVDAADYFAYQADMKRAVKEALDAGGVDIPFPTRTLFIEKDE